VGPLVSDRFTLLGPSYRGAEATWSPCTTVLPHAVATRARVKGCVGPTAGHCHLLTPTKPSSTATITAPPTRSLPSACSASMTLSLFGFVKKARRLSLSAPHKAPHHPLGSFACTAPLSPASRRAVGGSSRTGHPSSSSCQCSPSRVKSGQDLVSDRKP
jgi:hypothetical protein